MIEDVDDDGSGTVDLSEFRQFMMDSMVRRCEAKVLCTACAQAPAAT